MVPGQTFMLVMAQMLKDLILFTNNTRTTGADGTERARITARAGHITWCEQYLYY